MNKGEKLKNFKQRVNPSLALDEAINHINSKVETVNVEPIKLQRGVDYFTSEDVDNFVSLVETKIVLPKDGYTPIKGVDYFDGKNGVDGINGINGRNGIDGRNGKDGKDGPKGKDGRDGSSPDIKDIVSLVKKEPINFKDIKGTEDLVAFLKLGGFRGGGSSTSGTTSPLTTKGDIYTFSTVNTRLPVGSNGQVLSSDSTQTTGLKWITAPSSVSFGTNGEIPFMNAGGTDFSYTSNLKFNGNTFTLFGTIPLSSPSLIYSGDGSNMTWQTVDGILSPISVDGLLATITNSSLGTTQAANKGLLLTNNTAAAVGAQQISPAIVWQGSGWKTNATAGSEVVKFNAYILPVQEAAHPSASLLFRSSINGGAFATNFGVTSHGELIVNNSVGSAGYILSSNGPGVTASWIPSTTFALTNGSGTTANSTAVDLGGVLTADATIDGGGSADFFIKALKNSFGVGDTTYDSTADKGFIQFKTSGPLAWIGDGGGASHGTYVMVNDGTKIISLVGDGSSKILMKENTLGAASNGYVWTLVDQSTGEGGWVTAGGGGATTALDNLSGVAINAALVLGTSDAFALGSTTKQWSDLFLAEGGVINWDNGDATLTQTGNILALAGADFTVAGNITATPTADNQNTITVKNNAGNPALQFGTANGFATYGGIWGGNVTPSLANAIMFSNGTQTIFNSANEIFFRIGNVSLPASALYVNPSSNISIGTTTQTARLNILSTTEQLRIEYDASNYLSATVSSVGSTTFALTGTSPLFTFSQGVNLTAKLVKYNNITTAGWGIPAIYGSGRATAQVAANASVATYTVGAADGSFYISANVLVTTSSAENFTVTVAYTDEGNTARVLTLNFQTIAAVIGTGINFANGAVPYEGIPTHIRAKASTAITIKTAAGGTYTGCTYNVEGSITQIS